MLEADSSNLNKTCCVETIYLSIYKSFYFHKVQRVQEVIVSPLNEHHMCDLAFSFSL